jgi:hypothetical protein
MVISSYPWIVELMQKRSVGRLYRKLHYSLPCTDLSSLLPKDLIRERGACSVFMLSLAGGRLSANQYPGTLSASATPSIGRLFKMRNLKKLRVLIKPLVELEHMCYNGIAMASNSFQQTSLLFRFPPTHRKLFVAFRFFAGRISFSLLTATYRSSHMGFTKFDGSNMVALPAIN